MNSASKPKRPVKRRWNPDEPGVVNLKPLINRSNALLVGTTKEIDQLHYKVGNGWTLYNYIYHKEVGHYLGFRSIELSNDAPTRSSMEKCKRDKD